MQVSLDQGHAKLRSVTDQSERTQPNTSLPGAQTVQDQTEAFKLEYEKLQAGMSEGKVCLETALSQWGNFDDSYSQLNSWIKETEMRLRSEPDVKADLSEKKAQFEKCKVRINNFCDMEIIIVLT